MDIERHIPVNPTWPIIQQLELWPVLQRHCTENLKQTFPERTLRGLVPNSYIHVSVSDEPMVGIYKSLTDT
jgi:hypothetical protein